MNSFRKRLLVLIIGLVIVTQTVTLAAVLASTRRTVEARSWEQLRSGAGLAEQLVRFRAGQLANGVAVLASDFGFREAVASGHAPTILSAAHNNAQRIGADLVLVLDTHGHVLASTATALISPGAALEGLPPTAPAAATSRASVYSERTRTRYFSHPFARLRPLLGCSWASQSMTHSLPASATWSAARSSW
jgi:hypothetical protein